MRELLRAARLQKGLTQRQVAEYLGVSETAYQNMEYGTQIGKIKHWDKLEDLFDVHQRKLREITPPCDQSENPLKHETDQQA